ncbi:FAH family protein [Aphelenchoides bicaudatus]|nr:FAH family protein [Aphelenchoides bicaudatus]
MFVSRIMSSANLADFRNLTRKIVCVGRNYKDHAQELKNPIPEKPLLFLKGNNALIGNGEKIYVPAGCKDLHHEVELAVVIGKTASKVAKKDAWDFVGGYTVALDMTARDLQNELKSQGYPWFLAKSFDTSCPVADFLDKSKVPDPHKLELICTLNGQVRQRDTTDKMIFDIPTLIEFTTATVRLDPGDLILTGTPAGVGPCKPGDEIEIQLSDLLKAKFTVAE